MLAPPLKIEPEARIFDRQGAPAVLVRLEDAWRRRRPARPPKPASEPAPPDPPPTAGQILLEGGEKAWATLCFAICVGLVLLLF